MMIGSVSSRVGFRHESWNHLMLAPNITLLIASYVYYCNKKVTHKVIYYYKMDLTCYIT